MAVKHIPDNDQLRGLEMLDLNDQPLQILFVNGLRNRNSRFPEMTRFSEMQIGNDQRLFFFPIYRSVACKPELLI